MMGIKVIEETIKRKLRRIDHKNKNFFLIFQSFSYIQIFFLYSNLKFERQWVVFNKH